MSSFKKSIFTVIVFARINVRRYFRDRIALFFTIAFPLIFLLIFGGIFGKNSTVSFNIALINQSHSKFSQQIVKQITGSKVFKVKPGINTISQADLKMSRSEIDATLVLPPTFGDTKDNVPYGQVVVYYDENDAQEAQTLASVLQGTASGINARYVKMATPITIATKSTNTAGLTQFDYVFSGLLGFSIIGLGIFGPVNVFPQLKKEGILRRLHTSPLKVWQYFVSNVISQSIIGLISVAVMFIVAKLLFHLQMRGNYLELAIVVIFGIWVIFGIGLAIGGWAKNENQAAPLANIIVFPLMFLTGVFFPVYEMPIWLQHISTFLPLTPVIDSIRMIVTENTSLLNLGPQLGLMALWGVIIYAIAFRVFRWE
jgi:ABC-2 type transport system permease protein